LGDTAGVCPSCQAKRAALFGELLVTSVLEPVPHRHVVFTIPKALRGLFERERRLLSLLSRCAHDCVQRAARAYFDDPSLSVGTVAALQTFGSYAANFHPHVHAIVTDGAFAPDSHFERMGLWDAAALTELFRRLVLAALRREQRLSEEFHQNLLGWVHSGFSVHVGPALLPDDTASLEHVARYLTRAPLRLDAVRQTAQAVVVQTPIDPRTGQRDLHLDPLELIHRLVQQIPAPRQHTVRYVGGYSNRSRGARRRSEASRAAASPAAAAPRNTTPAQSVEQRARRCSWARLLRRIYVADPLLCPQCRVEMRIVAVIQEEGVVDRILRHLAMTGGRDPFEEPAEGRAPPAA
jgi:hypothetical protein